MGQSRMPRKRSIHVYPVDDLFPHDTESAGQCECNPKIEFENGETMVIHNAWDGREIFEEMEDK